MQSVFAVFSVDKVAGQVCHFSSKLHGTIILNFAPKMAFMRYRKSSAFSINIAYFKGVVN